MSENLINEDVEFPEIQKKSSKKTLIIVGVSIFLALAIIIVLIVILIHVGSKLQENNKLDYEIITVNFPSDIIYVGSHYNYQNQLLVIYQRNATSKNYFIGIANEDGKILKEIYVFKEGELDDLTYIHRASSFSDGKRLLIAGKILECSKQFLECDDPKVYDVEFPEEIKKMKNFWYLYTEPIVNYGDKYIFWSSFAHPLDIANFYGELKFENDKYKIINARGISNYFYDLYDKEKGTYSLPKIIRTGPIKQVIRGGEGLSIGGFLNYGLRKGIYQSLKKDELEQLTFFEGYDETTVISPDSQLECVMTTRFSEHTSLDIVGFIPTPYSIIPSYFVSNDLYMFSIVNLRVDETIKGNLGPSLIELRKLKEDKNYKGIKLNTDDKWVFNGFISWAPDNKKVMFDEVSKKMEKKRCQIVKLKNYEPGEINFKDNFDGNVPYSRSIEETINLRLDYPINITVNGKSGNLEIFHNETICEVIYNHFSEDNEVFYNGIYSYENNGNYSLFKVNIKSEGKKNGSCDYRLWFDKTKNIYLFDLSDDGKNKSYGGCNYEGKEIKVDIYQYEKMINI